MMADHTPLLWDDNRSHGHGSIRSRASNELDDLSNGELHREKSTSNKGASINTTTNTPRHSYRHEVLATSFIIMGPVAFGFVWGFAAPAVPSLKKQKILTPDEASWFESLLPLGAAFGSLFGGLMAEGLGRKTTHLLSVVPLTVGWLIILCCRTHLLLNVGRALTGISTGITPVSFGLYLAETVSKEIRGRLLMGFHAGSTFGIFVAYALGIVLDVQWLVVASMVPIVIMVCGTVFIPESPRWLLKKHRDAEATSALMWFRCGDEASVQPELREIKENIASHESQPDNDLSLWKDFIQSRKPIFISISFVLLQQASGIGPVLINIGEIFKDAGYTNSAGYSTVIVGAVKLLTTLITTSVIDKFGRRPPFILGGLLMGGSCLLFGFYFHYERVFESHCCLNWIPLMCLMVYVSGYGIGLGGIPWLVLPEVMPLRFRGMLSGVAASLAWILCFILSKEYIVIVSSLTQAGLFWIFAAVCLLGTLYAFLCMPETNQRSLEDIESSTTVSHNRT